MKNIRNEMKRKTVCNSLTVLFEDPFWIGVFEKNEDGKLSVSKVTFGAEPKDYEVYEFILKHYYNLQYSPFVIAAVKETKNNPKKMQREIKKSIGNIGIGTKSQQALKLQQEQNKLERRVKKQEQKKMEARKLFELKQKKRLEKHKGH